MRFDLGFSLWLLRSSRGWSQRQLARRLGVPRQSVSNWEIGVKTPTLRNLRKLCKSLDISVAVLVQLAEARALGVAVRDQYVRSGHKDLGG